MEEVDPEKLKKRLEVLTYGLNMKYIRVDKVVKYMIKNLNNGITTEEIDKLLAETCAYFNMLHPDYSFLAARISVSRLHKHTKENFAELIHEMRHYKDKAGKF